MKYAAVLLLHTIISFSMNGARADSMQRNPSGLYVPSRSIEAAKPSEFSNFEGDWCAKNEAQDSAVVRVCFGRLKLTSERSVRALFLNFADDTHELLFEAYPSAVELRNLSFTVIATKVGQARDGRAEEGRASVAIDARGEVIGVNASSPRTGRIIAFKGRR